MMCSALTSKNSERTSESKTSLDVQRLKLIKEREVSEDYQSFVSEGFIFSFQI